MTAHIDFSLCLYLHVPFHSFTDYLYFLEFSLYFPMLFVNKMSCQHFIFILLHVKKENFVSLSPHKLFQWAL